MHSDWPRMEYVRPRLDEAALERFEQRHGHRMPGGYRRFLLEMNGGRPHDESCRFPMGVINTFFGLGVTETRDLEDANSGIPALPSRELLYIGYADCGEILLCLAGDRRGQVWLQDPEARPDDANPRVSWHDRRDMRKLADSFEEFVRQLGPLTEPQQVVR